MTTIKIILGSTRPTSIAPAIGNWVAAGARETGTIDYVEVLDLAQIALPFLDEPEHPRTGRYTQPHTLAWSAAIADADSLVIVTPEYNGSFPAPVKNALDFLHREWRDKALGLVTYGGGPSGGARAAAALTPITTALGLVSAVNMVQIAKAPTRVVDGVFDAGVADDQSLARMLSEMIGIESELAPRRELPVAV